MSTEFAWTLAGRVGVGRGPSLVSRLVLVLGLSTLASRSPSSQTNRVIGLARGHGFPC